MRSFEPLGQRFLDPEKVDLDPETPEVGLLWDRLPPHVWKFGYIPKFDLWRPGDLILFAALAPSAIQRRIREVQLREGYAEWNARWHHAAVYIGDEYMCEAWPGGVRYCPVAELVGGHFVRVRRDTELTTEDGYRIAVRALMRLPRAYDYAEAAKRWLHAELEKRRFGPFASRGRSRDLGARKNATICSDLYHRSYADVARRTLTARLDKPALPADLSATSRLEDVPLAWAPLLRAPPPDSAP